MTRTMLKEKCLSKNFWAEAVACIAYLLNWCPSKSVENMTSQEAWSDYKPSVLHLNFFVCIAYAQVPETKRKKLDDHGKKCIFIGYSEELKAYKLYNPLTNKVVVSRDVIFSEDESWRWNDDITSKDKPLELEWQEEYVNYDGLERLSSTSHRYASSTGTSLIWSPGSISPSPIKMRNLEDIYAQIEENCMCTMSLLLWKKLWKRIVGGVPCKKKFMPLRKTIYENWLHFLQVKEPLVWNGCMRLSTQLMGGLSAIRQDL